MMTNKQIAAVLLSLIVGSAFGANYEILGTNGEGVVSVALTSGESTITESFCSPDVTKLVIARNGSAEICYLSPANGANTLEGGIVLTNAQLRYTGPSVNSCYGAGPIVFESDGGAFYAQKDADIPNKFVVSPEMWIASDGGNKRRLTLRNLGFNAGNANHVIGLGRSSSDGASVNVLSLTNENCEAIGQISMRGQLDLTLENRLPISGQRPDVFVRYHAKGSADVHVSTNGVTFDVAEGADVAMGVPIRTDTGIVVTNVADTVYPHNWSFESKSEGWLAEAGANTTEPKGVLSSPDGSFCSYTTPYGAKIMCIRWGNKLSTTASYPVNLPQSGKWRIAFVCASRKGSSNSIGGSVPITVTVDAGTGAAVSSVIPARTSECHDYLEVATEPFELDAGDHALQFVTGDGLKGNSAVMFDGIRFERIEYKSVRDGTITKFGPGKLTMNGVTSSGTLAVNEGTLALDVTEITNAMTVAIASGACLQLTDAGVTNLVANGSFQKDGTNYKDLSPMNVSGWTRAITKNRGSVNSGNIGLQGNGGNCSKTAPWTMFGTVTAYLRECTSFTQEIDVPTDGDYCLSFIEAYRQGYNEATNIVYAVTIGDTLVTSGYPTSSSAFTRHVAKVSLKQGRQNLVFHYGDDSLESAVGRAGALMFLDDVRLAPVGDVAPVRMAALDLKSGATLVLDNAYPCMLDTVRVDGQPVRAKNAKIAAAGVTVSGLGCIKSYSREGMTIIVR